jgi:hypothetical protein
LCERGKAIWNVGIGRIVGIGWRKSLANSEQIAAQLQVSIAEAVGQKAELADAGQAGKAARGVRSTA